MMEMFMLVLNKTAFLNDILQDMKDGGFRGATVLDCKGMLRELDLEDVDAPMMGLLRHYHAPERSSCKLVMATIDPEQRPRLTEIINRRIGGIDNVDAGIMFSVPLTNVWGLSKR